MQIYTIGFTKKSAVEFFETLKREGIKRVIDIRLTNKSQLAGFTKQDDLRYFLQEICGAEYLHEPRLAPSKELLEGLRDKRMGWEEYARRFLELLQERQAKDIFNPEFFQVPTVFLCSEAEADHCHRRIVAEHLVESWENVMVIHL